MQWMWIVLGVVVMVNLVLLVELALAWRAGQRGQNKGRWWPND